MRTHVVDREDVRVIQRRGRPSFALEALERARIPIDVVGEELGRHPSAEARVFSLEHDAHAAASELRENAVMRDVRSDHG